MPADVEGMTIGWSGVDIYPLQTGVSLEDVESFGGGSPTDVVIAAARLGRSAAVLTGVGEDFFGPSSGARWFGSASRLTS